MNCPKCNEVVSEGSAFCTNCGASVYESDTRAEPSPQVNLTKHENDESQQPPAAVQASQPDYNSAYAPPVSGGNQAGPSAASGSTYAPHGGHADHSQGQSNPGRVSPADYPPPPPPPGNAPPYYPGQQTNVELAPVVSIGRYLGLFLLYCIPVAGLIILIVKAASAKNRNVQNMSIAILILLAVFAVLSTVIALVTISILGPIIAKYGYEFWTEFGREFSIVIH